MVPEWILNLARSHLPWILHVRIVIAEGKQGLLVVQPDKDTRKQAKEESKEGASQVGRVCESILYALERSAGATEYFLRRTAERDSSGSFQPQICDETIRFDCYPQTRTTTTVATKEQFTGKVLQGKYRCGLFEEHE